MFVHLNYFPRCANVLQTQRIMLGERQATNVKNFLIYILMDEILINSYVSLKPSSSLSQSINVFQSYVGV